MAFSYYASITVDNTKVGGSANLSHFPVLINGTYDGTGSEPDLTANARADGYDIRFYSDSGLSSALDFELVSFNSGTGALIAWVRIPTLDYDDDTVFYMAYGDAALDSDGSSTTTWTTGNYDLVMHLEESVNNDADGYKDSTEVYDGTGVSMGIAAPSGKVGTGAEFDGTSDYIKFGDVLDKEADEAFSFSFWMITDDQTEHQFPMTKQVQGAPYDGWYTYWRANAGADVWFNFGIVSSDGGSAEMSDRTITYTQATWYHVFVSYDGSANASGWTLVRNGSEIAGVTTVVDDLDSADTTTNSVELNISSRQNGTFPFNGILDEVRVFGEEKSAGWGITEYNNQNAPDGDFYTMGNETEPSAGGTVQDLLGGIIPFER